MPGGQRLRMRAATAGTGLGNSSTQHGRHLTDNFQTSLPADFCHEAVPVYSNYYKITQRSRNETYWQNCGLHDQLGWCFWVRERLLLSHPRWPPEMHIQTPARKRNVFEGVGCTRTTRQAFHVCVFPHVVGPFLLKQNKDNISPEPSPPLNGVRSVAIGFTGRLSVSSQYALLRLITYSGNCHHRWTRKPCLHVSVTCPPPTRHCPVHRSFKDGFLWTNALQ